MIFARRRVKSGKGSKGRPVLALILALVLPGHGAWLTDLGEAREQAAREEKGILLVFTALKISGACVQFEKRVLSQEQFQNALKDRAVLVHLDVPLQQTPGMKSPRDGHRLLAKEYGVEVYPSLFYLDARGRISARDDGVITGGPAEAARKVLGKFGRIRKRRAAFEQAYKKEGLERARALIEILKSRPRGASAEAEEEHLAELARLDPQDRLNFQRSRRAEIAFAKLEKRLTELFAGGGHGEAAGLVDDYLAKFEPADVLRQKVLFRKLAAFKHTGRMAEAKEVAAKVVALDPDSPHGRFAAQILKR